MCISMRTLRTFLFIFSVVLMFTGDRAFSVDTHDSQNPIINSQDCPITPSPAQSHSPSKQAPRLFKINSLLNMIHDSAGALDTLRLTKRDDVVNIIGELAKSDFFSKDFNGNLILDPEADSDQEKILSLIEYLDKNKENSAGAELLNAINEYYHLCLYQFILNYTNMPKKLSIAINSYYDELYSAKNSEIFPFRTALSKIMIYVSIVLDSEDSYRVKQENLVYLLNAIKHELLDINASLDQANQIDKTNITGLIEALQAHTLEIPVIQPKNLKKWIFWGSVAITLTVATVLVMQEPVQEYIKENFEKFWRYIDEKIEQSLERIGHGLSNGLLKNKDFTDTIEKGVKKVTKEAGSGVSEGAVDGLVNGIGHQFVRLGTTLKNGAVAVGEFVKEKFTPDRLCGTPAQPSPQQNGDNK